jgi:hypothetical protein
LGRRIHDCPKRAEERPGNLLIVDLKTEAEANLVVAAMTTLSDDGITSNVIPITDQGQPARY